MELVVIQKKIYELRGHKVMLDFDLCILGDDEVLYFQRRFRWTRFERRCHGRTDCWNGLGIKPRRGAAAVCPAISAPEARRIRPWSSPRRR